MDREPKNLAIFSRDAALEYTEHHLAEDFPGLRLSQVAGCSMEWKERQEGYSQLTDSTDRQAGSRQKTGRVSL